jgi:histidyl-tRNA synthetase
VVDKVERQTEDETAASLRGVGLAAGRVRAVLELLGAGGTEYVESRLGDREEVGAELERISAYMGMLAAMGLGDYVEVDLRIVRGLAYYTGIVFELFDRRGELRAICGGGRYDRLLELVGGEPQPAAGFGMGDVVLGELLAERGLRPPYERALDYFLVPVTPEQRDAVLRIAHALRDHGRSVAYALREQAVGKQLKAAGREGAREVLIVGPEELERGCVVARDMSSGSEREVAIGELG